MGARIRLALIVAGCLTLLASAVVFRASRRVSRVPAQGSDTSAALAPSFYRGLASLQVGLLDEARDAFTRATEIAAGEPASWANLGLVHLRLGQLDRARAPIERAAALSPQNGDVRFLLARLHMAQGRFDDAVASLRRAVELDSSNLRARFALVQELERAGGPNADALAQEELERIVSLEPNNLAVLLERVRLAAKRNDGARLSETLMRLVQHRSRWSAPIVQQYESLKRATDARNFAEASRAGAFFRNVLLPTPSFQEGSARVTSPAELFARPFERFLVLPVPSSTPAPPDEGLTFSGEWFGRVDDGRWRFVLQASLDGAARPVIFAASEVELRRLGDMETAFPPAPAGSAVVPVSGSSLVALDWNHDFKTDLAIAGRGGVRLLVQMPGGVFADATPKGRGAWGSDLPDCFGAWPVDVEMDGDLDLVVGLETGAPIVLRNHGDGDWSAQRPFAGVSSVRGFAWGDMDADGDPDAVFLDAAGDLQVFANQQAGAFLLAEDVPALRRLLAFAVGDLNADGVLDLVTLDAGGTIRRLSMGRGGWDEQVMATWSGLDVGAPGASRLILADIDNNGGLDLLASGGGRARVWLADQRLNLRPLPSAIDVAISSVTDLDGDGLLDLVGLSEGRVVRLLGRGTKSYHWQVVRPRAQQRSGDQRINSFGIGGEIEVRAGLLAQKRIVDGTSVHFGLGDRTGIDVARILWPNGTVQAEFDRSADRVVVAEQRLKGSCPWVFADDGTGMRFVTDFLWRSPLGLRINAQDTAGVTQTEDWTRIRGDQLAPRDNFYDVRVTAELWETHFVDHTSLLVVDHPDDVEVFVDERFSRTPPTLSVRATRRPRTVRAWNDAGEEVTDLVGREDGRYVGPPKLGPYQGIAHDHVLEIELDQEIPRDRRQWLLAHGWVYPTDSSINVAIGQGRHEGPRGLALEALDDNGHWVVAAPDLGFPAGKNKTVLIDLAAVTRAGVNRVRRIRLRTNLEVYWDRLAVGDAVERPALELTRLQPIRADLRSRGFSETRYDRRDQPELPRYDEIANIGPRWRDLTGYYTRFGDVRELLDRVDDRYVIMNAGDEIRMLFQAQRPPTSGRTRDFVLIGDGWVKDGDFNTGFSKFVHPLPSHDRPDYSTTVAARELEHDPVYRRHARDWQTYHIRFVTPREFIRSFWLR